MIRNPKHSSITTTTTKMITLLFIVLLPLSTSISYQVPITPSITTSSTLKYMINYQQQQQQFNNTTTTAWKLANSQHNNNQPNLQDTIIRVPLASKLRPQDITNIYDIKIQQLQSQDGGSNTGNDMCGIVKIQQQAELYQKFVYKYQLYQDKTATQIQDIPVSQSQEFISTIHINKHISYKNSNQSIHSIHSNTIIHQQIIQTVLYMLTSKHRLHIQNITQRQSKIYQPYNVLPISASSLSIDYRASSIQSNNNNNNKDNNKYSPLFQPEHLTINNKQQQPVLKLELKQQQNLEICGGKSMVLAVVQHRPVVLCQAIVQQQDNNNGNETNYEYQIGVYPIRMLSNKWQILQQQGVTINIDQDNTVFQYKTNNNKLYILTSTSVYEIYGNNDNNKLQLKQLSIKTASTSSSSSNNNNSNINNLVTFTAVTISKTPYLLLISKTNGLLIYNLLTSTLQHTQPLKQLQLQSITSISYTSHTNIKMNNNNNNNNNKIEGILHIVIVVDGRKQFVIQMFHSISNNIGNTNTNINNNRHQLYVNKIYHGYNANTNIINTYTISQQQQQQIQQQQYQQQQQQQYQYQQYDNIHKIQHILYLSSPSSITNNLGILKSKHKLQFFQYGIPRSVSPIISLTSEFINQLSLSSIVNVDNLLNLESQSVIMDMDRNYTKNQIENIKKQANNTGRSVYSKNILHLSTYILTLKHYVYIIQIDPRNLWHYQYQCNLNQYGIMTDRHKMLNNVKITMQTLCSDDSLHIDHNINNNNNNNDNKMNNKQILQQCTLTQTILFDINYLTPQQQINYKKHTKFIGLIILICIILFIIFIVLYRKIKANQRKLQQIKKDRFTKLRQNTTIDVSVLDQNTKQKFQQVIKEEVKQEVIA